MPTCYAPSWMAPLPIRRQDWKPWMVLESSTGGQCSVLSWPGPNRPEDREFLCISSDLLGRTFGNRAGVTSGALPTTSFATFISSLGAMLIVRKLCPLCGWFSCHPCQISLVASVLVINTDREVELRAGMINNPSRLYPKAFYQQQLKRMGSIFEPIDLPAGSISAAYFQFGLVF